MSSLEKVRLVITRTWVKISFISLAFAVRPVAIIRKRKNISNHWN